MAVPYAFPKMPVDAPLAVTMGDPAGIGLEITLKLLSTADAAALPALRLYADPAAVAATAERLGIRLGVREVDAASRPLRRAGEVEVVPVALASPAHWGRPDPANAAAVMRAIELATADVVAGRARALVTNPIAKSVLYAGGFSYPGHTEYLAALAEKLVPGAPARPVMMLASEDVRVVPLTIHVPLADVPRSISTDSIVEVGKITLEALKTDFAIASPRLVVAGLNPHAGEGGSIGTEDRDVIAPALARLTAEGYRVRGPLPADTLFHAAARREYDAALCMYHDQALIPIKTLAFETAVNVTLGLPFVRTSPDHGTAFDIAGKGLASPSSLKAAIELADRIASRRARHDP